MLRGNQKKKRVCVLVKAHPHPSQKYTETVCCAGISDEGELLRLYPIPYRSLSKRQQFDRFDWIEVVLTKAEPDPRPESHRVDPESIRIIAPASKDPAGRYKFWRPFVVDSLNALKQEQAAGGKSLGIVKPDPESVQFAWSKLKEEDAETRRLAEDVYRQMSLWGPREVRPLPRSDYAFSYRFTSGGFEHRMKIHDWEVEAAYHKFRKLYGDNAALEKMQEVYEGFAQKNLHLIMGNMQKRPHQFIIIGVLRSALEPGAIDSQPPLL